jgi:hypothetical protein
LQKFLRMGRIKRFNLQKLIEQANAKYFFETGTWKGDGLAYASKYDFNKLYSSEIISSVAQKAIERFKSDDRVVIVNDTSVDALKKYNQEIKGNCIYWLDAHFPGAEEGLNGYNEFQDENVKLPLQKELEIISERKNTYSDIILIDDLRIYETGAFESGNLPENVLPPSIRTTKFAYTLFGDTHNILKSFRDEGYMYILPKNLAHLSGLKTLLYSVQDQLLKKII